MDHKEIYRQKLQDPRWQRKRLEIFQRDNFSCLSCGRNDLPLHVHHLSYLIGKEPWDHPNFLLATYCEYCHNSEHEYNMREPLNDFIIELIKDNHLMIQPVAQLCVLVEKYEPFRIHLKAFLKEQMIAYLKTRS